MSTAGNNLSAETIRQYEIEHVLYPWVAQKGLNPVMIDRQGKLFLRSVGEEVPGLHLHVRLQQPRVTPTRGWWKPFPGSRQGYPRPHRPLPPKPRRSWRGFWPK